MRNEIGGKKRKLMKERGEMTRRKKGRKRKREIKV